MENEKETVIPARKRLVIKRKASVKKEVVAKQVTAVESVEIPETSETVQVSEVPKENNVQEEEKALTSEKKRPGRGRRKKTQSKEAEKVQPELIPEVIQDSASEESTVQQPEQISPVTVETIAPETQIQQPEDTNKSDHQQKGKGKYQNQKQKKVFTMEEVSVSEEEYKADLETRILINDLSALPVNNLKVKLSEMTGQKTEDFAELKKQEIVVEILKAHSQNQGVIYAKGTLEILQDGYGFLRSPLNSYLPGSEDVYISAGMIKFLNLKTGDTIEGIIRNPKENERFFAMNRIATVNGDAPIVAKTRTSFDSLIPLYPDSRINLETERKDDDVSMRIINLFCPIGKGQRALITAPPRTGKTILLQQIANAITTNHPEIHLIVLLVDERPEEVTDMRRNVHGEVIASTFDEQATRHVQVAEMVIEKAKRLVEHKQDVVILLDSITRLARAYNQTVPASGKILSGGVDSNALHKPKRFFGAARNIENGGSLTIIASALIETGSRMDEVIFEEFKGTGNSEIVLDRMMAERRLFPAINIKKSGTRREDLLLEQEEANRIWILRNNVLNGLEDYDITRLLVDKMRKTKNNEAFLRSMNTGAVPVN